MQRSEFKTINIYGAFDRVNYGDLLFPVVIKKALDERLQNLNYAYHGLIDSDLSRFGGVPTSAIRRRFRSVASNEQRDVFIVAGGEVLPVSMYYASQCLVESDIARKVYSRLQRIFGSKFSDELSRYLLKSKLPIPFIIDKEMLPGVSCMIYNAIGGVLPEKYRQLSEKYIRQADYISVRDEHTLENLKAVIPDIDASLCPDSATVMAKYFPVNDLENTVNSETQHILHGYRDGYICFQVSASSYQLAPDVIREQLVNLFNKTGLPILLLPIGRAPWHSDQLALQAIKSDAVYPCILPAENTIYDIMALIAHSRLFIGTSLHGLITAMCYSIPSVPINPRISKVKWYIETWYDSVCSSPVEYSSITEEALKALKMNTDRLFSRQLQVLERAELNFDAIADCIKSRT